MSTGRPSQVVHAWPPGLRAAPDQSPVLSPEEEMKTFFLPPGYRVELVASEPMIEEPVFVDIGSRRPPVGHRDAGLHAGHLRNRRARAARTHQRPRGSERRREDGQEDHLPRQAGAAAGAEGARSRRARRRTSQLVARPRHERRPARRHERARDEHATDGSTPTSSTTRTACCGRSTTGCTRPRPTSSCGSGRGPSRCARRCRAGSGARPRTMPGGFTATRTSRSCTSIWSRRRISRGTRACCARAGATSPCAATRTR